MKICENGIVREMTAEEIAECEKMAAEIPAPEPSLEDQVKELREALDLLLSGETEAKS